ncbi:hypothetical protein CYMTET_23887 [Cymbomonas tetramitiformis]|uniref:Uncharacterized protein n=1 Tax=Cymbomonas tetramitiformis TaxID=36881 RepID=A0AAE0FWX0_9CHLO|nr:hypothetical protein CYMTET_23887 [Cymbomonas tetramitiformis]
MPTLALCQIFQVAADDGSAVLAGGESDGIDVSAYGFAVSYSSSGVMSELETLTGQVRAMEEKVGMHLSHVSLLEDDDVHEHPAPVGAPSANAVASGAPRQVVPHGGGASAGGAPAAGHYAAHYSVPTEEFLGGVDLVPVRHYVPSMAIEPLISAVACSFEPAAESFVEPAEAHEHCSIDEFLAGSENDELGQSGNAGSFVGTVCGQSTNRPQQVMGCRAPPPGLRPNFVLLACFLGLLGTGFAGAAGIGGASGSGMPAAEAQPTAVPPPDYWRPEGHYASDYNPHGWTWYPGPSRPPLCGTLCWAAFASPSSPPYSPGHELEEVAQPALNGNRDSARDGLYIDDSYGMDLTAPLHRAGSNNIADILTQPLHPRAIFYENPSYYGLELRSETFDNDSGYGSAMDEVD